MARQAFAQAFKKNPSTLSVAEAYARHAVNNNNRQLAKQTITPISPSRSGHPLSEALLAEIEAGKTPPLLIASPQQGLAEVFYGIGDALAGEGGLDMGIIFLQFALYLEPDFPLAYAALAEAYDGAKKYELEMQALDQIKPDSPLWLNVQIQKSFALNSIERVDDAKVLLEGLVKTDEKDVRPLDALGNILRSHERYEEARDYYTRALALIPKPDQGKLDAVLFARGLQRAAQGLAGRRGRFQGSARAVSRPVPGAQLSRLFLGRPGQQSEAGDGLHPQGGEAQA